MIPKREPYKTIFKLLSFLGLWNEIPKWHKRIAMSMMILCTAGLCTVIMLSLLQAKDLSDVLEGIKVIPILLTIAISVNDFIFKKSKVCDLLELIEEIEDENPESKSHFEEAFRLIRNIFMAEFIFIGILFISFVLSPLIITKLTFPAYIPDIIKDYDATFYIYWMYESLSGLYCTFLHLPIHEFRCSLLIVLNGYVGFFRDKLRNLQATKENCEEAKKQLTSCVKIHHQMKKFMDTYMDIFSLQLSTILFLTSFCVCSNTFIIATLGSNAGLKANAFSLFYEIFVIFLIFIPCFYANTIQHQSENFMYDLFMSDWIESGVKYQKLMLFFMENLKNKIVFKVLGFVEIDLMLFVQIIKVVYSMYAVLQSIKN